MNSEQEIVAAPQQTLLGPTKMARGYDWSSFFGLLAVESQMNDGLFSVSVRFSTFR